MSQIYNLLISELANKCTSAIAKCY